MLLKKMEETDDDLLCYDLASVLHYCSFSSSSWIHRFVSQTDAMKVAHHLVLNQTHAGFEDYIVCR
jgi:hypothetical protein